MGIAVVAVRCESHRSRTELLLLLLPDHHQVEGGDVKITAAQTTESSKEASEGETALFFFFSFSSHRSQATATEKAERRQLRRLLVAIDSLSQSVICALPLSYCLPADVTTSSTWSCSFFFSIIWFAFLRFRLVV